MEILTTELDYCDRFCENNKTRCPIYGNCINRKMYEKLAEYEDLEEQGKLVKLPCNVGDTIYEIDFGRIDNYVVTGFSLGKVTGDEDEDPFDELTIHYQNYNGSIICGCAMSEIGETVFLVKEQAEEALKN